jgi:hypothetical protein
MSTPLRYYWRSYHEQVIGELMGGRARYDRDFVRRHGDTRQVSPPTPQGYLWQLLALAVSPGTLGWLSQVTAETLVVTGDDDPVMPLGNVLLLAHHIPRARLSVAPGEGHLLLMDDRSRCLPVIRSFLSADAVSRSCAWREAIVVDDKMLEDTLPGAPLKSHGAHEHVGTQIPPCAAQTSQGLQVVHADLLLDRHAERVEHARDHRVKGRGHRQLDALRDVEVSSELVVDRIGHVAGDDRISERQRGPSLRR